MTTAAISTTTRSTATRQTSRSQTRTTARTATSSSLQVPTVPSSSSTSTGLAAAPLPTIPQGVFPGAVVVTQPPQQSTAVFGIAPNQPITFAWNFTYVTATPTHLTVSAVCPNGTYPVGPSNGIIPGSATSVVWDTYAYQTSHPQLPLAQANYTLTIWGDRGPNAVPLPGFLSPNSAVHFVLYTNPISSAAASGSGAAPQHLYHPAFVGSMFSLLVIFLSGSLLMRRF